MCAVRPEGTPSTPVHSSVPAVSGGSSTGHVSVMPGEVAEFFGGLAVTGVIVDGTAGGGGHMDILLRECPEVSLLGVDLDPAAAAALTEKYRGESRVTVRHGSYTSIPGMLRELGIGPVAGALFDLGLSSIQLDDPARGFAHSTDGPLDMRFDPTGGSTAGNLVNRLSRTELADLIYRYGEEGRSRRIASAIVDARPIYSTGQLADVVRRSVRGNPVKVLSRVFQALRIAVNSELSELEELLQGISEWTAAGAGVAVITFHSMEDRIVKLFFRDSPDFSPTDPPWITATASEVSSNPRSRSARLRTAVRS